MLSSQTGKAPDSSLPSFSLSSFSVSSVSFPASLLCLVPFPRPHSRSWSLKPLPPLAWALCKSGASFLLSPLLSSLSRGLLLWEPSDPDCGHLCCLHQPHWAAALLQSSVQGCPKKKETQPAFIGLPDCSGDMFCPLQDRSEVAEKHLAGGRVNRTGSSRGGRWVGEPDPCGPCGRADDLYHPPVSPALTGGSGWCPEARLGHVPGNVLALVFPSTGEHICPQGRAADRAGVPGTVGPVLPARLLHLLAAHEPWL